MKYCIDCKWSNGAYCSNPKLGFKPDDPVWGNGNLVECLSYDCREKRGWWDKFLLGDNCGVNGDWFEKEKE